MSKSNSKERILQLVEDQRNYFSSGKPRDVDFRLEQLKALKKAINKYEPEIYKALHTDLHKSEYEAYMTETSVVLTELNYHIRKIRKWAKPKRITTPYFLLPSSSRIYSEPYGCTLIIAPWNYPFQLLINPLIGAISAGNCAILRPSPYTPHVSAILKEMIEKTFPSEYITVIEGSKDENQILLAEKFDHIFFTGSPGFGKAVMKAAAEHLTPVTLELGGKSPCIIDRDADINAAARRVAWGKLLNAGQTCIAPDHVWVHEEVKEAFVASLIRNIEKFYGEDARKSPDFPRIVNQEAWERLGKYLKEGKIIYGGKTDDSDNYISPTLIEDFDLNGEMMQNEIFGPILPLKQFNEISEVIKYINSRPKPLALYYFGKENREKLLRSTSAGGVCINDTIMHIANHHLPFGGVGNSGFGKYHGRHSFATFSHEKSVLISRTWFDIPIKFAPFKNLNLLKRLLGK